MLIAAMAASQRNANRRARGGGGALPGRRRIMPQGYQQNYGIMNNVRP